jgi:HTH-type transcriptional regulator, sugar sensing transcriptional regulator
MQETIKESVEVLTTLGFNELEAATYTFLVEHSPVTAYRISKGIGKPVANTYKAVESLKEKGAVLIDETGNKLCRAVPPEELLQKMENQFRHRQQKAERVLSLLRPVEAGEGIYSLTTIDEVFSTCAAMLARAEKVVIIDAFPQILEQLKNHLETIANSGIFVSAQMYAPMEIPKVASAVSNQSKLTLERWQGQWLCLVVDGAEYLFAYLDTNGTHVHQAIWSQSAFLAWIQYGNMANALLASELEQLIQEGASRNDLLEAIKRKAKWLQPNLRGYQQLQAKFESKNSIE